MLFGIFLSIIRPIWQKQHLRSYGDLSERPNPSDNVMLIFLIPCGSDVCSLVSGNEVDSEVTYTVLIATAITAIAITTIVMAVTLFTSNHVSIKL